MMKRLSALLLVACLALGLTGCAGDDSLFANIKQSDIESWKSSSDTMVQTADMLGFDNMKEMVSDSGLTLYMNEKTTEIAVKTADGTVWYSNPQDRLSYNGYMQGNYSSQLLITQIDSSETTSLVNNFDESVRYGQFNVKTDAAKKNVTVDYLFGKKVETPLYPAALTIEKYEEIASKLSKSDQYKFSTYYMLVDMESMTNPKEKEIIEESFTKAGSLGQFRKLMNSPSAAILRRLTGYLETAGFTADDRDAQEEAVGYVKADNGIDYCSISISYTLKDGRLVVDVPMDKIKTSEKLILKSITVLPHWNTKDGRKTTDLLIPDGSGAIVHLGKQVVSGTAPYKEKLYGIDYSRKQTNSTSEKKGLAFPVYGLTNKDGSMYAVASGADATAYMTVEPCDASDRIAYSGFDFQLVDTEEVRMTADDADPVMTYANEATLDPVTVDFTFLPKSNNGWVDIAQDYKARLTKEGKLSDAGTGDRVPVAVDFIGAADDIKTVVGVPTEYIVPLTTFSQAEEIAKELNKALSDSELVLSYEGWSTGGMKATVQNSLKIESKVGTVKDLQSLADTAEELKARFFPMTDIQYVYRNNLFDGFTTSGDAARGILREAAYKAEFSASNFMADKEGFYGYLVSPNKQAKVLDSFLKSYDAKVKIPGLGLTYFASDLSSDYNRSRFLTRNAAVGKAQEMLASAAEAHDLMSSGANLYALSSLDVATNVPMSSNVSPLIAYSVPFTQMLLSGTMTYAAENWNSQADSDYYALQCIETGSAPNFTVISADNSHLKYTKYDQWYNVTYSTIRPEIEKVSKTVTEALSDVYGAKMTGYERLSDQVVKVTYDNGHFVIVNYGSEAYTSKDGVVESASYLKG